MAGVSAQEHVGDGHDGIVEKGVGLWWMGEEEICLVRGPYKRYGGRTMGRTNMER